MTLTRFVLRSRNKRLPDWTAAEDKKLIRLKERELPESTIAEKFEGSRTPSAVKNRIWRLRKEGRL